MHNVTHELKGDQLIITVDVSAKAVKTAPPSSTGKTLLVATTGGAMPVSCQHANLTLAINVMAKR